MYSLTVTPTTSPLPPPLLPERHTPCGPAATHARPLLLLMIRIIYHHLLLRSVINVPSRAFPLIRDERVCWCISTVVQCSLVVPFARTMPANATDNRVNRVCYCIRTM